VIPSITAIADAQAHVEQHMPRPLTQDEAERFRQHIRDAYRAEELSHAD
jgi:hypothetical protein